MKQPELGQKIAHIRKQKNLTQEELEERCHVSVRTIQRIEAGEVTPRSSTIKILMAALDHDLEEIMQEQSANQSWLKKSFLIDFNANQSKEVKAVLQTAWIAGVIYFVLGLIDTGMDYVNLTEAMDVTQLIFFTAVKVSVFSSYFLFMRGFVALGQLFNNYLLKVSSYLMIATFLVFNAFDIFEAFNHLEEELYLYIQSGFAMTFGAIGIFLGVAFWKLQDGMGRLAAVAGVFELLIGLFLLTVILFFLSLVLLIPATIVEIVLLYKAYELVSEEQKTGIKAPLI